MGSIRLPRMYSLGLSGEPEPVLILGSKQTVKTLPSDACLNLKLEV